MTRLKTNIYVHCDFWQSANICRDINSILSRILPTSSLPSPLQPPPSPCLYLGLIIIRTVSLNCDCSSLSWACSSFSSLLLAVGLDSKSLHPSRMASPQKHPETTVVSKLHLSRNYGNSFISPSLYSKALKTSNPSKYSIWTSIAVLNVSLSEPKHGVSQIDQEHQPTGGFRKTWWIFWWGLQDLHVSVSSVVILCVLHRNFNLSISLSLYIIYDMYVHTPSSSYCWRKTLVVGRLRKSL